MNFKTIKLLFNQNQENNHDLTRREIHTKFNKYLARQTQPKFVIVLRK